MNTAPLRFRPVYSSAIWGGRWLKALYGRADAPAVAAESSEISGHAYGMSVVTEGPYAGRTLADLAMEFGRDLVGTSAPLPVSRFPLLLKLIDARRALSVQVHPNVRTVPLTKGEPKTEAWFVLAAAPGAALYAGVKDGVTPEMVRAAAENSAGELAGMLRRHPVAPGDVLYIPGGVVHAIGEGVMVFEVQQSSNTTFRLYDWDRVDANGRSRELHVAQALQAIDWTFPTVEVRRRMALGAKDGYKIVRLLKTEFFRMDELRLDGAYERPMDGASFVAVFAANGSARVTTPDGSCHVARGTSVLVPASAASCRFQADVIGTRLLVTTL